MNVRMGVDEDLEALANEMIFAVTRVTTSHEAKRDILTPWKEQDRAAHEVLVPVADPSQRQGTYTRALGKGALNSREGMANYAPRRPGPMHAWMVEQGHNPQRIGPSGRKCDGHHGAYGRTACINSCGNSRGREQ